MVLDLQSVSDKDCVNPPNPHIRLFTTIYLIKEIFLSE